MEGTEVRHDEGGWRRQRSNNDEGGWRRQRSDMMREGGEGQRSDVVRKQRRQRPEIRHGEGWRTPPCPVQKNVPTHENTNIFK